LKKLIIILFFISSIALSDTYTYQFQIAWDNGVDVVWQDIEPKSIEYLDGELIEFHSYYGRIGDNAFISKSYNSTPENPKKVKATFSILGIPTTNPFNNEVGAYRIRSKLFCYYANANKTVESEWSEPSNLVIVDTRLLVQTVNLYRGWNLVACVGKPVISSIAELTKDTPSIPAHAALIWDAETATKVITDKFEYGNCYLFPVTAPTQLRIEYYRR
jgi:hypothetical protein